MDDWLIDDDCLPLERKSILPGEGFFVPGAIEAEQAEQEAADALDGAGVVVIADPDADGLACVALAREAFGEGALLAAGPQEMAEATEWVATYAEPDATVLICDLCPDSGDDLAHLEALVERVAGVRWYDHHQWEDDPAATVDAAGVARVVGQSEEVCTADVVVDALDYDFPDRFVELARVTRDHDLWIREDERSDDLADLAYWLEPEEYIEAVLEHGPDLSPDIREFLGEMRVEKEALVEKAVERAELREVGPWTVGVTYGRCSQNEVAEALREHGADAAVVVKPAGSASIRGTERFERCHEVARQVNGGGHPRAAGCKPDVYDDMLDYAHHWTTRGAVAKQAIVDAFRRLPEDAAPDSG